MPVIGRIEWMLRQVEMGRHLHISVGSAADANKIKYKCTLANPQDGQVSRIVAACTSDLLRSLRTMAAHYVCVDRGHKHHSTGCAVVSIWMHSAFDIVPGDAAMEEAVQENQVASAATCPFVVEALAPPDESHSSSHAVASCFVAIVGGRGSLDALPSLEEVEDHAVMPQACDSKDRAAEAPGNVATWPSDASGALHAVSEVHRRSEGCSDNLVVKVTPASSSRSPHHSDNVMLDIDVPGKSWDRKRFQALSLRLQDEDVSSKAWQWIKERFKQRFGKTTLNIGKALDALSEKELLAAIRFLETGDDLDLALPMFRVVHLQDVGAEPTSDDNQARDGEVAAGPPTNDDEDDRVHFKMAPLTKRSMAQPKSRKKRR